MKNIENRLKGTSSNPISSKELASLASKNGEKIIDILFKLINEELDTYHGTENLDSIYRYLNHLNGVLVQTSDINKKAIERRLSKLSSKIDRIIIEHSNKWPDRKLGIKKLEKVQAKVETVFDEVDKKEPKAYTFINTLIENTKNLSSIEVVFEKMPSIVNAKDKDNICLLENIIKRLIISIENNEDEDLLYYTNLISLILRQKSLSISNNDTRNCEQLLLKEINKLSYKKKKAKANSEKIEFLNELLEKLRSSDEKVKDISMLATKYSIPISFDERLIEELNMYTTPFSEAKYPNRVIIDDYIITIDGGGAIEIDDALSCKKLPNGNYLLGVHIASVLGYLPYESLPVQEAISRHSSIYLPHPFQNSENDFNKTIPILPYSFSAEHASLLPNAPKLARSYYYEISPSGEVVNERFLKSIINSKRKATYQEINDVLENGTINEPLQELVTNLNQVANALEKSYHPNELYEGLKEASNDSADLRVKMVGAEKIVYLCSMLTGHRVASFFANSKEGYPCVYRVHEVDENLNNQLQAMVKSLTDNYGGEQYKQLSSLLSGVYPRGWYDLQGSHNGLGLDHYCHCTSELRRAPDILVEHALEVCYDKTPTDQEIALLEQELREKTNLINSRAKPIEWFTEEFSKVYRKRR